MDENRIDPNALNRAIELVSAAYGDAMHKAGMLDGKIKEVHMRAAVTLVKTDEQEEGPEDLPERQQKR